jgi:hypothetical protein
MKLTVDKEIDFKPDEDEDEPKPRRKSHIVRRMAKEAEKTQRED